MNAVNHAVDHEAIRTLIRAKLADGRLPHNSIPRFWGGRAAGEVCDGCELTIEEADLVMEGVSTDIAKRALQFHVGCFALWDDERDTPWE
jgi:hypothetical protein